MALAFFLTAESFIRKAIGGFIHHIKTLFLLSVIALFSLPTLAGIYVAEPEQWKRAGEYLDAHADGGDTITIIGGVPEFVQLYAEKKLTYRKPASVAAINSTWVLVSNQYNSFWASGEVNANRTAFDGLAANYSAVRFNGLVLYRKNKY